MTNVLIHDVSHWQGDLSNYWQMFKDKGCAAVIVKATEGLAYYNSFKEQASQAKEKGFLVGSYHYFRQQIKNMEGTWVNCDPIRQAENYYSWTVKCGIDLDLPPALDIEGGNNPYLNASTITKCLERIEKLFGRTPLVYSSPNVLINLLGNPAWGRYPLWLAHYTTEDKITVPKAWDKWTIWQFGDKITYDKTNASGTVVSRKPIDHNWFNGDIMDLLEFCQKDAIPEEPPDPNAPKQVRTITNLRGRTQPVYIPGQSALIYPPNTVLDVIDEPEVYEAASGITWLPVKMWVSKAYTTEV